MGPIAGDYAGRIKVGKVDVESAGPQNAQIDPPPAATVWICCASCSGSARNCGSTRSKLW